MGVLAFGDSITNGGGELQWGVALQSWALWVARGLALPFTCYAVDGARVRDVVEHQIPALERLTVRQPRAGYHLGCLYIGVNDVRSHDWDPWDAVAFSERFRIALEFLVDRCERVLAVMAPLDLGRPRSVRLVQDLDDVVSEVAGELGTLLLDLRSWGARNLVMTDHVHPTAFGQIDIAERALAVLEGAGMHVAARPSRMIHYSPSRRQRLQGDWTYVYRRAKVTAGLPWVRARMALSPYKPAGWRTVGNVDRYSADGVPIFSTPPPPPQAPWEPPDS
jgi:lysophospholipase L1-like esterase